MSLDNSKNVTLLKWACSISKVKLFRLIQLDFLRKSNAFQYNVFAWCKRTKLRVPWIKTAKKNNFATQQFKNVHGVLGPSENPNTKITRLLETPVLLWKHNQKTKSRPWWGYFSGTPYFWQFRPSCPRVSWFRPWAADSGRWVSGCSSLTHSIVTSDELPSCAASSALAEMKTTRRRRSSTSQLKFSASSRKWVKNLSMKTQLSSS